MSHHEKDGGGLMKRRYTMKLYPRAAQAEAIDLRERVFLADTNIPQIPHQSTATDAEAA